MADTKINSAGKQQPIDAKSRYAKMSASEMSKELAQEADASKSNFIKLNLFAANYSNQTDKELNKSRISHEKQIEKHNYKIAHPQEFYKNWDQMLPEEQVGRLKQWEKEIRNYHNQIELINKELKKRGNRNEG